MKLKFFCSIYSVLLSAGKWWNMVLCLYVSLTGICCWFRTWKLAEDHGVSWKRLECLDFVGFVVAVCMAACCTKHFFIPSSMSCIVCIADRLFSDLTRLITATPFCHFLWPPAVIRISSFSKDCQTSCGPGFNQPLYVHKGNDGPTDQAQNAVLMSNCI